jgi:Flp pilus assembly pilin Flp
MKEFLGLVAAPAVSRFVKDENGATAIDTV